MLKDNIKKIRESHSISQRELARRIDMSGQMISKIERGETNPSIDTLNKIANALGVTLSDLVEFKVISFSCNLITIIQSAYIKHNGYSVHDIFQVLSDNLKLDYEIFNCYKAKKNIRTDNSDGTHTFMDVKNEDFDISKNLPVDIQVKLLAYLSNVDYPTFSGFIKIHEKKIQDTPDLYEASLKIKCVNYINELIKETPNDKTLSTILEHISSTGEISVEDIAAIDRYKEAEYVDYALDSRSITINKNNSYALFIKFLASLEYKSDEISGNAAYLFKKIKAQIELEMNLIKDDDTK